MKPDFSPDSSASILKIIYGYQLAHCVNVAANLNIAEQLYDYPKTVNTLAAATDTDPAALYRLLRILASEGIFKEIEDQVFAFTEKANALHGATEGSMKYFLQAILGEHAPAFGNLIHSVKTGQTAFDDHYKMDVWEYYGKHPETAANFNKAMAGLTQYLAKTAVPAYDFNSFNSIVDIGGGNGALLFAILKATSKAKGIIFDAPHVIPQSLQMIEQEQLNNRCEAIGGNFFESVPEGKDLYLLKYILHDWTDEDGINILRNCSKAMHKGSKVLIVESVIPPGNEHHAGRYMDITMLACTRGRERNMGDFRHMLNEAGLILNKVIELPIQEISLIEGEKK